MSWTHGTAGLSVTDERWDHRALDREASAWLVRLDDEPGDAALYAELERWLARSAAHRASWNDTLVLSGLIEAALPHDDADCVDRDADHDNVVMLTPRRPLRERLSRHWRKAGFAVAAAVAGFLIVPDAALHLRADAIAGTGEVRAVVLSDGSKAFLSPGSALAFDGDGKSRSARLIRGRAFFDVTRDPRRPFKVEVGDAAVRVLGTAFEVDLEDGGASVAVERGLVEVAYPRRGIRDRLSSGEAIRLEWHGAATHVQVRPDRIAAWKEGKLFVRNRPIGEVLAELRPWHSGYMVTRGSGLHARRVTGIYDLRNPEAALAALAKAHPLEVRRITPWLTIVTVS